MTSFPSNSRNHTQLAIRYIYNDEPLISRKNTLRHYSSFRMDLDSSDKDVDYEWTIKNVELPDVYTDQDIGNVNILIVLVYWLILVLLISGYLTEYYELVTISGVISMLYLISLYCGNVFGCCCKERIKLEKIHYDFNGKWIKILNIFRNTPVSIAFVDDDLYYNSYFNYTRKSLVNDYIE